MSVRMMKVSGTVLCKLLITKRILTVQSSPHCAVSRKVKYSWLDRKPPFIQSIDQLLCFFHIWNISRCFSLILAVTYALINRLKYDTTVNCKILSVTPRWCQFRDVGGNRSTRWKAIYPPLSLSLSMTNFSILRSLSSGIWIEHQRRDMLWSAPLWSSYS